MEYLFSEDEVKDAYLKLKNMIYYDKSYFLTEINLLHLNLKTKYVNHQLKIYLKS